MYPAYTLRDTLNEYAISFFALLNEGYRLQYTDAQLLAQISDLPHMDKSDRKKFYQNLEWAAMHPSDILRTGEGSDPAEIKRLLGG